MNMSKVGRRLIVANRCRIDTNAHKYQIYYIYAYIARRPSILYK